MPDGSNMSQGATGKIGICTKLKMSEAAVKSAVRAIRFEFIALFMECTFRFFIPDYTVGPGISPGRPRFAARGLMRPARGLAVHLPPVGNCTPP